ncbi:MAG TPA: hypothetical protein VFH31_09835, partial [Pyrinomonadaceae bacterium]|nr:hypothetical protein [Pyrinomonadaceae bacterium]
MKRSRAISNLLRVSMLVLLWFAGASPGIAQHEGHTMPTKPAPKTKPTPRPAPTTPVAKPTSSPGTIPQKSEEVSTPSDTEADTKASETTSLMVMDGDRMAIQVGSNTANLMPMGKMGSGTSWQPASTQMNMLHKPAGEWLVMFHYNVIAGVNAQGGPRGVTKVESQNWFMPTALRRVGNGTLELRSMFSFEPFTFPPGGSPLLFQTGETYKGQPIIDRQHPHDLFMELSASYTVPIGDRATWFAYFGYPGEPALGPVAFMHRASASENPSAPLSHHLQDSSHIS